MRKVHLAAAAIVLAAGGAAAGIAASSGPAAAGIGPAGFAQIAQQAIIAEDCKIYGGCSSSPWRVRCVDHPSYALPLSDQVTCSITEKP